MILQQFRHWLRETRQALGPSRRRPWTQASIETLVTEGSVAEIPRMSGDSSTSEAASTIHSRRSYANRAALSDSAIRLAVRLRAAKGPEKKLIAFLGLTEEDGSSVAASQTAEALALMGLGRVVLVDGNLHAPHLHRLHDIPDAPGLLEVLRGQASLEQAEYPAANDNLFIVPTAEAQEAGETEANITSLLTGETMTRFVERLRSHCRFGVFDLAPVGRVADASVLASLTDAVIIVAARGKRSRTELLETRRGLETAGAAVLGVALSERR